MPGLKSLGLMTSRLPEPTGGRPVALLVAVDNHCPRCGGTLVTNYGETACLMCAREVVTR